MKSLYPAIAFAFAVFGPVAGGLAPSAAAATDALFQRLLAAPDDRNLNREFAAEAEARGDLRHALAALERVRNAYPDDREVSAEYERVRRELLPTITVGIVERGTSMASNSYQLPNGMRRHVDGYLDAAAIVEDERTVSDMRWRSRVAALGQLHWENTELTGGSVSVESGPVFQLDRDVWMHLAPGAAMAWLDYHRLYTEASAGVTFGTVINGLTQTLTARYGWRRGNEDVQNSDSDVIDVVGQLITSPSLIKGDDLYFQPRWHQSIAVDPLPANVLGQTVLGPSTLVSRDLSPWSYREWGGRLAYFFPVAQGRIMLGAGLAVMQRDYINAYVLDPAALVAGIQVATGQKREDLYVEPTAHVVFPHLLGPTLDLRVDYRFEDNHSNDSYREFQNHVAGVRIIGRM